MRILAKTNVAFTDVVWVFDSAGAGVTGLVDAGFTAKVTLKNGVRVATPTFTLTEIDSTNAPGAYVVAFTPDADAAWQLRFKHATYNVRGWTINLTSYARGLDDHAWPTTAGRSLNVSAAGEADANVAKWLTVAPNALQSGRVDSYLGAVAAGVIAAASFASGALAAVWDALTSALATSGSIGKLIVDNLNATVSSRLASASYTAPLDATATENAVWNTVLASHTTAGTTGKKLGDLSTTAPPSAATIAAAVAEESLSGHTTAGTLGEAILRLRSAILGSGTLQSASVLDATASSDDQAYRGALLIPTGGTGVGQGGKLIATYNGTTKAFTTYANFGTSLDGTTTYVILAVSDYSRYVGDLLGTVAALGAGAITGSSISAGAITASKFGTGAITSTVLADDAITAAKIAADAIGSSELAADAATEIADALLDRASAIDGSTPRDTLARIAASSHGKVSGMASGTPTFLGQDGSTSRIVATVDADGNRTAVTLP